MCVCVEMQQKLLFTHLTWRILYFANVVAIPHVLDVVGVSKLRLQLQFYIKPLLAEWALSLNLIYALVEAF